MKEGENRVLEVPVSHDTQLSSIAVTGHSAVLPVHFPSYLNYFILGLTCLKYSLDYFNFLNFM